VEVTLTAVSGELRLDVQDDGRGPPDMSPEQLERGGHMGLAGMRERITALGGRVTFGRARGGSGAALAVLVPVRPQERP
jgi:signal transduction histidine kinase